MNKISLLTSLLVALPSFAANYPDALRGNYVENSNADSRACDNPYLVPDRKPIKFAKTTLAGRYQPIIRAHSVVN